MNKREYVEQRLLEKWMCDINIFTFDEWKNDLRIRRKQAIAQKEFAKNWTFSTNMYFSTHSIMFEEFHKFDQNTDEGWGF